MYRFLLKQHIRQQAEFDAVFKQGRRLNYKCFTLIDMQNKRDYARLGIVVGKKNCPLAVRRNRIKRLIREQFRLNQQVIAGKDIVILLRSPINRINDQEQRECFEQLFSQCAASVLH